MVIYVVVFGSSGGPVVEFAGHTRKECRDYLAGKIVPGCMDQFIHQVHLEDRCANCGAYRRECERCGE